jgi:hypothetical protein
MKKITLIALTLCGLLSFAFAQSAFSPNATAVSINPESRVSTKAGAATFATTTHNFGEIKAGEAVSYTFDLKNTGEGESCHYECKAKLWLHRARVHTRCY